MVIFLDWNTFKELLNNKKLNIQYLEYETNYNLWVLDGIDKYLCIVDKTEPSNEYQFEFENLYKNNSNKSNEPKSEDGKQIIRQESRPLGFTTIFSGVGDSQEAIGEGVNLEWDFSNSNGEIIAPQGYKRKRIEFNFLDEVYLKDGTIYFYNALKGSYVDFFVICPTGCYYYDNNENIKVATEDTKVVHYVIKHRIQGDCPMGDELNTESCGKSIPSCYKFSMEITVPENDILSNGYVDIELYRKRSIIL